MGITKSWPVSAKWIVMVPVVTSPGFVPLNDTQIRTSRSSALGAGPSDTPPSGRLNCPGPDVTLGPAVTLRVIGPQVCTENRAARDVSTPAGTSLKLIVGV